MERWRHQTFNYLVKSRAKDAAGRYHGRYGGQEFTVWRPESSWSAECPAIAVAIDCYPTRADAVRRICDAINEAAAVIPELDQLLERWAAAVGVVVDQLGDRPQDVKARTALINLRHTLSWLDGSVRTQAVRFERDLAKLQGPRRGERRPRAARAPGRGARGAGRGYLP